MANTHVIFRFDVGSKVGAGHFVRCQLIAKQLVNLGVTCSAVISSDSKLPMINDDTIFSNIITLSNLDDGKELVKICHSLQVQTVLIDHYHCDHKYQLQLINSGIKWGQFDYFCSGHYLGEFVVNINPSRTEKDYRGSTLGSTTQLLCGLEYVVIREQFCHLKQLDLPALNQQQGATLFVSFGAGTTAPFAIDLLQALQNLTAVEQIHFLTTSLNSQLPKIKHIIDPQKCQIWVDHDDVATLVSECHYGIISCGTMSYELAKLGVPFTAGYLVDNQKVLLDGWQQTGLIDSVGFWPEANLEQLLLNIKQYLSNYDLLMQRRQMLRLAVDGFGSQRIAEKLIQHDF